jgi:hypothetical protein
VVWAVKLLHTMARLFKTIIYEILNIVNIIGYKRLHV